jgi:Flp pilus assembly protein CpaB
MRPIQRSSPSYLVPIVLGGGFLTLAGVCIVGTLWTLGVIDLPFLTRRAPEFVPPPGTVPVLLSVKPIPAYTRITRDHLFHLDGKPKLFYLTPEEIERSGIYADFGKLNGRVVSHDLREGYAMREKDFLPEGAREGIAGGTPAGKRSLTVDASKIAGIGGFKNGDHFDLVASYVMDLPTEDAKKRPGPITVVQLPGQKKYTISRVLVQDGVVVRGMTTQPTPKPNSTVPNSGKMTMVAIQEIILAVEPDEVAPITEAMNGATDLRAVHRSGQPTESSQSTDTPGTPIRPNPVVVIEVIRGGKTEYLSFLPRQASPPSPQNAPKYFAQSASQGAPR